tara:strand:+ start:283 stop:384 length:102 start_codon:yes stop_codon:yes gene_type:complete
MSKLSDFVSHLQGVNNIFKETQGVALGCLVAVL